MSKFKLRFTATAELEIDTDDYKALRDFATVEPTPENIAAAEARWMESGLTNFADICDNITSIKVEAI